MPVQATPPVIALAVTSSNEEAIDSLVEMSNVQDLFKAAPALYQVAICESGLRQFDSSGEVLHGIKVPSDTGILQINAQYHEAEAESLGYDIDSLGGNIQFGIWLYNQEGLRPWNASKYCWGGKV